MSLSLLDLFVSMGLFAKVIVFILLVMSVLSWANAVQKYLQIHRSEKQTRRFAPEFSRFLQEENLDAAIKLAEKQKQSHVARVVGEALAEVKPLLRDRATITAADINSVERAVEREILIVSAELKRGLGRRRLARLGVVGHRRGPHHDGVRPHRRDPRGVALQLFLHQDRFPLGGDDLHLERADRLPDQERGIGIRPLDLHEGVPDAEGVAEQWPYQSLAPGRSSRPTSTSRRSST